MTPRMLLSITAAACLLGGCASTPPTVSEPIARDQRPPEYQPKQVGPKAMEAWIAPWEDATGDLYPPASVYIEVNQRAWQYGDGSGRMKVLRPLQVEQRERQPAPTQMPFRPDPAALGRPSVAAPARGA